MSDRTPDAKAARDLENVLGAEVAMQLIKQLPSPRHAQVLQIRLRGDLNWNEVAAEVGVSEKTARTYWKQVEVCLRELLARPEWKEG